MDYIGISRKLEERNELFKILKELEKIIYKENNKKPCIVLNNEQTNKINNLFIKLNKKCCNV